MSAIAAVTLHVAAVVCLFMPMQMLKVGQIDAFGRFVAAAWIVSAFIFATATAGVLR